MMKTNQTGQRVYYADTDHGGVVYYSNYLKWFEIGRTELLREYGFDCTDFEKQRLLAPVVEAHCIYRHPAQYNDQIIIKTKIEKIGNSSIKFHYEIIRQNDGRLLAEGYTVNVFADEKTMKSVPIPKELRKRIEEK